MAEGWAKALHPDRYQVYSAGLEAHGLNPRAVQVMLESGVDISDQASQTLADLDEVGIDLVITVCGHADENCPVLPAATRRMHVPFDDPPALARQETNEEERLGHYRRVRDEIRSLVERLPEMLSE